MKTASVEDHCEAELLLLDLLDEVDRLLHIALNSLGGKLPATTQAHYLG